MEGKDAVARTRDLVRIRGKQTAAAATHRRGGARGRNSQTERRRQLNGHARRRPRSEHPRNRTRSGAVSIRGSEHTPLAARLHVKCIARAAARTLP